MMHGLLLLESLSDTNALDLIRVTKKETWQVKNAAAYQPLVWTAISFEADESQADVIANAFSRALKPAWYINASNETHVYVVFPKRVYKYLKGDMIERQAAKEHGLSLGIPEHQLDWEE